jgi:hypothetical protein
VEVKGGGRAHAPGSGGWALTGCRSGAETKALAAEQGADLDRLLEALGHVSRSPPRHVRVDEKKERAAALPDTHPNGWDSGGEVLVLEPGATGVRVPAIDNQNVDAYAAAIGKLKLVPQIQKQFDATPKGTLFATIPAGGETVPAGGTVTLLVSGGFPEIAHDDDHNVRLIGGAKGKKLGSIAKGPAVEKDPTWSFDGSELADQADGQIFLKDMLKPKSSTTALTDGSESFKDLAWAPTGNAKVLAMLREPSDPSQVRQLCLGEIVGKQMAEPACLPAPQGIELDRTIRWAPNGKSMLIFGFGADQNLTKTDVLGMGRYRTSTPFSTNPRDWHGGTFVTPHSQPTNGALDASFSADGKRIAEIDNFNGPGQFRVSLIKPNDLQLQHRHKLNVIGCKVIWRPDDKDLLVVHASDCAQEITGELLGVSRIVLRLGHVGLQFGIQSAPEQRVEVGVGQRVGDRERLPRRQPHRRRLARAHRRRPVGRAGDARTRPARLRDLRRQRRHAAPARRRPPGGRCRVADRPRGSSDRAHRAPRQARPGALLRARL